MDHQDSNEASRRRSSRIRAVGVASIPAQQASLENDSSSSSSAAPPRKRNAAARTKKSKAKRSHFQDVTNTVAASQKRNSSSSSSEAAFHESPLKKSRRTASTLDAALARKTVTPVAPSNKNLSTAVRSQIGNIATELLKSASRKASDASSSAIALPHGVVNLYPAASKSRPCVCDDNHCSSQSQSHCFLNHYGKDYFQSLKDWETLYFPTNSADVDSLSSDDTRSFGGASSAASSSHRSRGTPPNRVNYVIGSVAEEESLMGSSSSSSTTLLEHQPHLTEKMRGVLIDWLIELSEEYKLSARTLHLTAVLLNRSLEGSDNGIVDHDENKGDDESSSMMSATKGRRLVMDRDMFQCLGCACMWMASKMEEITSPSVDDFVYISADSYSKREITEMEMGVCSALQFRLWHVTPLDFCEEFLRASANKRRIGCPVVERSLERSMVEYLLALSLLPYELVSVAPRKVAAAAVYLARVVLGMEQPWSPTLQHYSGFTMWDLEDTVLTIHRYHAAAEESKLSNAFHKFSKEKYHHVALKTVPLEQHLGF